VAPRYSETEAREAVAASYSYAETLRRLSMCPSGGAWRVLRKWLEIWEIPTDHFDPRLRTAQAAARGQGTLEQVLVDGSHVRSSRLKDRLYAAGLKRRQCELCGQGETWQGRRMSLILDHVNGKRDDNRLENLRIVCPNCNATLETHCSRNGKVVDERPCEGCGKLTVFDRPRTRFCSLRCSASRRRPAQRRVERPPAAQLRDDVEQLGWVGTGRKYGVSDNAVRKWVRAYAQQRELEEREGA
jgi:hypothetical protein